ncbi:MAG: acyl carrier protein [Polyangiaceae bacterium]|nr:acyl carrier protein [Polyangiaceae bacterium]
MTREEIENVLLNVLAKKFKINKPDHDKNLFEHYDFDSIDALEMLEDLETRHGFRLSLDQKKQLFEHRSINQLTRYLETALKGDP